VKNILIIYPHWPPSNLAGVHRARLISNFLPDFNWQPIILTVKQEYYEEKPDFDFVKTVNPKTEVIYTEAKKIGKTKIVGDIGLRSFKYLKIKALKIISERKIDFIWIPIPSFYVAVLGRVLFNKTKTPYGIDYIDPWVRDISNRKNIRSKLSNIVAKILEPYSVKKASLISGVSTPYYQPVLDRNFKNKKIEHVGMPYGFDPNDHKVTIKNIKYPWDNYPNCKPIIYAGAFLPLSGYFTELLFKNIKKLKDKNKLDENVKLFFIGTGNYTHKSITDYANEAEIEDIVIEIRQLLGNIKENQLTANDAKQIAPFFINLTQQQTSNLASGFSGIYTDLNTTPQTRQNIHYLLPYLWERVDESTRQGFGVKYGKYVANNDREKASLARQFLEIVNGVAYIPDDLKAAEIESAIQNLLSAHQ